MCFVFHEENFTVLPPLVRIRMLQGMRIRIRRQKNCLTEYHFSVRVRIPVFGTASPA